jgi:outer membrane usher protein
MGRQFSTSCSRQVRIFSLGTWTAFHDFPESSQRLTIGSVGTNLSARTTSEMSIDANMGFTVEKSYSYGSGSALRNQFQYSIEVIEPSTVKIYMNGEEESNVVFQRRLTAGTYRLKDFVFTQGANKIRIDIIPESRPMTYPPNMWTPANDSACWGGDRCTAMVAQHGRQHSNEEAHSISKSLKDTYLSYYPQFIPLYVNPSSDGYLHTSLDLSHSRGYQRTFNGVWATMSGPPIPGTTRFSERLRAVIHGTKTERFNDRDEKLGS